MGCEVFGEGGFAALPGAEDCGDAECPQRLLDLAEVIGSTDRHLALKISIRTTKLQGNRFPLHRQLEAGIPAWLR